jgi:hypothetical protein
MELTTNHEGCIDDSLDKDAPNLRPVEPKPAPSATIISLPCRARAAYIIGAPGSQRQREPAVRDSLAPDDMA